MSAVLGAGFVFWGVFLVFLAILAAYVLWMVAVERKETGRGETGEGEGPG